MVIAPTSLIQTLPSRVPGQWETPTAALLVIASRAIDLTVVTSLLTVAVKVERGEEVTMMAEGQTRHPQDSQTVLSQRNQLPLIPMAMNHWGATNGVILVRQARGSDKVTLNTLTTVVNKLRYGD